MSNTAYDRLLDIFHDLKEDIALCPFCQKVLLKTYLDGHVRRYHGRSNADV